MMQIFLISDLPKTRPDMQLSVLGPPNLNPEFSAAKLEFFPLIHNAST